MISLLTPTGSKTLTPRGVMNAAGVKKSIDLVAMQTGAGDIDVWTPAEVVDALVVTTNAPGNYVSGYGASPGPASVSTAILTASAAGAVGAVTWLWEYDSGNPDLNISAETSPTTGFFAIVEAGFTMSAFFTVTATDSLGRTGQATVNASVTNYLWGGY